MKQGRLSREELHQLKWLLGGVLSLISFWTLAGVGTGNSSAALPAAALTVVSLLFPGLPGRLPAAFWNAAAVLLAAIIVLDFYLYRSEVLPPLMRMITLLLLLRCLGYRRTREDLQLLLLCLFMTVLSGVLTMSLLFAAQLVLFTPVAMVLLFIINLLDNGRTEALTRESWKGFHLGRFLGRVFRLMDLRLAGLAAALFVLMVGVTSLIFILMPRFRFDHAIPFLQLKSGGLTGFSDTVELGGVTDIVQDNRVALRLDAPSRESIPVDPYFRMLVLDFYSNGQFSLSRSVKRDPALVRHFAASRVDAAMAGRVPLYDGETPAAAPGLWTFYLEGGISSYLPLLGPFQQMRFQKRQEVEANVAFHVINLESATQGVFSYQVYAMQPTAVVAASRQERNTLPSAAPLVASRQDRVWQELRYPQTLLALPLEEADAAWLRDEVRKITGGLPLDAREFSRRAVEYLWSRHRYSLSSRVESGSRDKVVSWMMQQSPGHCEYFAAAFTLLARTAGYATRVVVGFNGGSWNTVEHYFTVRNRHAHAWCEIFDGRDKWHRIDPTPGDQRLLEAGLSAGIRGIAEERGWSAYVDSLRILWYRSIVNFDDQSQEELAGRMRWLGLALRRELTQTADAVAGRVTSWLKGPWTMQRAGETAAMILLLALCVLLLEHRRWWLGRLRFSRFGRRLTGRRPDPLRRQAGRMLQGYGKALEGMAQTGMEESAGVRSGRVLTDLQSLRFGDLSNRDQAGRIFREVRRIMRYRRKAGEMGRG